MVAIRISNALRAARSCRAAVAGPPQTPAVYRRGMSTTPRVLAQQGYGDGKGSPEGEKPQQTPGATQAQESSEHPGPAPPDVGRGTGGGPTKAPTAPGKSPEDASAASGGARSKEAQETGESPTGGEVPGSHKGGEALKGAQGKDAPKPKVLNQSVPGAKPGLSKEQKQEVEAHNAEFEQRHDRAPPAAADKVNKNFWKGTYVLLFPCVLTMDPHDPVSSQRQAGHSMLYTVLTRMYCRGGRDGKDIDWNA